MFIVEVREKEICFSDVNPSTVKYGKSKDPKKPDELQPGYRVLPMKHTRSGGLILNLMQVLELAKALEKHEKEINERVRGVFGEYITVKVQDSTAAKPVAKPAPGKPAVPPATPTIEK